MYLTEAWLDGRRALQRRLYDSYDWHKAVWEAFPGHADDQRQFLTRIDQIAGRYRLYIVSDWEPQPPDWWPEPSRTWRVRTIPASFFSHSRYAFQLRANPTRKVVKLDASGQPTPNGRREPLRTREELVQWMVRKGAQGGFAVEEATLRIVPSGRQYFRKGSAVGLHSAVDYRGALRVTDAVLFEQSFRKGIGPAKGYGFGLLILAPLPETEIPSGQAKE